MPTRTHDTRQVLSEIHARVEATLFLENAFVSERELAKKVECNIDDIPQIINTLNENYVHDKHAFFVLEEHKSYLLTINQELSTSLAHLYRVKNKQKLSKALLETLSVIAYSQPMTKSEVDKLRGVNSDGAIKLLLSQGLIKIIGKKSVPGNPNQYVTTPEFLKIFGLKSIKDLPKLSEQDMKKFLASKSVKEEPIESDETR